MAAQAGYNASPGFGQEPTPGIHLGNDVWILPAITTTPTNGTSGTGVGYAGKGSIVCNTAIGEWYVNYNTAASPSWSPMALIS
jgi:hypothetical protein